MLICVSTRDLAAIGAMCIGMLPKASVISVLALLMDIFLAALGDGVRPSVSPVASVASRSGQSALSEPHTPAGNKSLGLAVVCAVTGEAKAFLGDACLSVD